MTVALVSRNSLMSLMGAFRFAGDHGVPTASAGRRSEPFAARSRFSEGIYLCQSGGMRDRVGKTYGVKRPAA